MNSGEINLVSEYYVICELYRNGFEALKAMNANQKGWDIIVFKNDTNIKIQVKGIECKTKENTKTNPTITVDNFEFDFMILVLINYKDDKYRTLIIPKDKFKEKCEDGSERYVLSDKDGNIYYKNRSISISKLLNGNDNVIFKNYENNWDSIANFNRPV